MQRSSMPMQCAIHDSSLRTLCHQSEHHHPSVEVVTELQSANAGHAAHATIVSIRKSESLQLRRDVGTFGVPPLL